ncbi:MAG: hypothetical protein M1828_005037 [Chrysothrix sp. TS-e1954]|nr:MAG: hypothetical protein M1828_005037 [Chrysothrix sp. TS-e1954]
MALTKSPSYASFRCLCNCSRRPQTLQHRTIQRLFCTSATRRKHGAIPSFQTTSPDLNTLLSTIRSKILLPGHLNIAQQKLVYRAKNHAMLRTDPVSVEIGDETFQLEPIDRTHDVPDSWDSLLQAIDLMKKTQRGEDWRNLGRLLAGMRKAGRRWKTWQWEKIVRDTGDGGAYWVLLECVRSCERTGLTLGSIRVVREIMWAGRTNAVRSGWDEMSKMKVLRYLEEICLLLPARRHREALVNSEEKIDPQRQPDIIGVILELATARLDSLENGTETASEAQKDVEMYLKRLLPTLGDSSLESPDFANAPPGLTANYELLRWVPVYKGLESARKLLGNGTPHKEVVDRKLGELSKRLETCRTIIVDDNEGSEQHKSRRRGLEWLKEANINHSA